MPEKVIWQSGLHKSFVIYIQSVSIPIINELAVVYPG
jgi:hypothetical protein